MMKKNEEKMKEKMKHKAKRWQKRAMLSEWKTRNIRLYAQHALKRNFLVIAWNMKKLTVPYNTNLQSTPNNDDKKYLLYKTCKKNDITTSTLLCIRDQRHKKKAAKEDNRIWIRKNLSLYSKKTTEAASVNEANTAPRFGHEKRLQVQYIHKKLIK
jgi:hypothetical protein